MNKNEVSNNRRTEYQSLREEIYRSDRTCLMLIGFLITATAAIGKIFSQEELGLPLVMLSATWFLAFWYFTEKRFVIKLISNYLRTEIESVEEGLQWQQFLSKLPTKVRRPVLPFGPYYLEVVVCSMILIGNPIFGITHKIWVINDWEAILTISIAVLFILYAIRSIHCYSTIRKRYDKWIRNKKKIKGKNKQ